MRNQAWLLLGLAVLMTGFSWFGKQETPAQAVAEAKKDMEAGDLYQARKRIQKALKKDPTSIEAQKLMAEIIDQEIARHREAFRENAPEELPKTQTKEEVRTWIERGRTLLELKRYEEALLATEKVFNYEEDNLEASRLMDRIRNEALKAGKAEELAQREIYQDEINDRVSGYTAQARAWIREGKWGAARLAVEKMLLLDPSNQEAQKLQKQIEAHNEQAKAAAGAK